MNTEVEVNPYDLLDIKDEATEQEIKTAYRKRSLKVHPDRNPNNADAARKFHELNQAYELLLDPLRRLALNAKLRLKKARAERYKSFDNKKRNLVEELEAREREFKRAKVAKEKEELQRWHQTEEIKDQGRKLREEKERELRQKEEERKRAAMEAEEDEMAAPSLDPLDTTVRIKYSLKSHSELTTADSIAKLMATFGQTDVESIVLSLKPPKKDVNKPAKTGTALVPFKQIGDAFAAVCASGRPERGLNGIEVGWVGSKEPPILAWLKKMGKLGTPPPPKLSQPSAQNVTSSRNVQSPQAPSTSDGSPFSSFPSSFPDILPAQKIADVSAPGIDYESLTLMRLRQAERERLEREIREQEAED
ncbi:hypothetical protein H0H92_013559 [Tricholoma furcatifolium]|nr:hypothetical protein H0H92_013559 [Tricholoma furcatifolium]